jgi:hypothetical protein
MSMCRQIITRTSLRSLSFPSSPFHKSLRAAAAGFSVPCFIAVSLIIMSMSSLEENKGINKTQFRSPVLLLQSCDELPLSEYV